ncbi:hypothetical protein J3D46_003698 [Paenarthrobacter sp. A20]|nr:hypothetical protein [Paenarthrobacter sp. A20]
MRPLLLTRMRTNAAPDFSDRQRKN